MKKITIKIKRKTAEAIGSVICGAIYAIPFLIILANM